MDVESAEEIARIKAELWEEDVDIEMDAAGPQERLVAEGDSWFDYMPGLDILDHLKREHGYKIKKYSEGGDTLENMVYGTEYRRNWNRKTPQILETLEAIDKYRPKVFLFSGGGNDFAGDELDAYFNHKDAGLPSLIRDDYLNYVIHGVFKKAYQDMIDQVLGVDSSIHIIGHGYGYAIPDGRAVINVLGYKFVGPWLRPTFTRKNILSITERRQMINIIIKEFNAMLSDVDQQNDNFHYLDLREHIQDRDWVNELHVYNDVFKRIAGLFHTEIQKYI